MKPPRAEQPHPGRAPGQPHSWNSCSVGEPAPSPRVYLLLGPRCWAWGAPWGSCASPRQGGAGLGSKVPAPKGLLMDGETKLAKGAVPHRLDVTHSVNSSQSAPVKVTPAGDCRDAEAERKLRTSVGHPLPLAVPGTAGPGISGMLPEEMLIHDNISPPRAPRVCCWGSWEHWALPSEKQLQG